MRELTLDEKISIKGELVPHAPASFLVRLTMAEALRMYWRCFGVPLALYGTRKHFRQSLRRAIRR